MKITTTNYSRDDHPEFRIFFDESIPQGDIDWLISVLGRSVQNGSRYTDGELVGIGSMLVQLALTDGCFVIQEPNFREFPIVWAIGVTNSLRQLRLQKDVAESLGLDNEVNFPTIRESVIVGNDVDAKMNELVMDRTDSAGSDSGWFIGRFDASLDYDDPNNLHRISVYEAIVNWSQIAGFLALPPSTRVEMSKGGLAIYYGGERLIVKKGSFLDRANM